MIAIANKNESFPTKKQSADANSSGSTSQATTNANLFASENKNVPASDPPLLTEHISCQLAAPDDNTQLNHGTTCTTGVLLPWCTTSGVSRSTTLSSNTVAPVVVPLLLSDQDHLSCFTPIQHTGDSDLASCSSTLNLPGGMSWDCESLPPGASSYATEEAEINLFPDYSLML